MVAFIESTGEGIAWSERTNVESTRSSAAIALVPTFFRNSRRSSQIGSFWLTFVILLILHDLNDGDPSGKNISTRWTAPRLCQATIKRADELPDLMPQAILRRYSI